MINDELLCTEHHTNVVIFCEWIKTKPELNERMIKYNFALRKMQFDQLFKKRNIMGFFHC